MRRVFFLTFLLSCSMTAWAHPHVWVDWGGILEASPDGSHLTQLRLELAWDDYYTSLITTDYPDLAKGTLTGDQAEAVDKAYGIRAGGNWRDWVRVSWNDKPVELQGLVLDKVTMIGNRAEFYYRVPLNVSLGSSGGTLKASVTDRSYYTDIGLRNVKTGEFEGTSRLHARISFYEDQSDAYYGGMVFPQILAFQISR